MRKKNLYIYTEPYEKFLLTYIVLYYYPFGTNYIAIIIVLRSLDK